MDRSLDDRAAPLSTPRARLGGDGRWEHVGRVVLCVMGLLVIGAVVAWWW